MCGNQQDKIWTIQKKGNVIGRVVTINPIDGERYYLWLLLYHIRGVTSFEHLKNINDIQTLSFHEANLLHGLLEVDNNIELSLKEASLYQIPYTLRHLFATILIYYKPNNPRKLWENFEKTMSDDYLLLYNKSTDIRSKVLKHISCILESMGKSMDDYHVVYYNINLNNEEHTFKEINEELQIIVDENDIVATKSLNPEQKYTYD